MQNDKPINGHAVPVIRPELAHVPAVLMEMKDAFTLWVPAERKLRVGSMLYNGFVKPRVNLELVWPQYAAWLITDEVYGALQYLPDNKPLHSLGQEIARLLEIKGRGADVPEERMQELRAALLPHGERITDSKNPSAGAAWQVLFNCANDNAPFALRYGMAANITGQPGDKTTAVKATINTYLRKLAELLKL